MVMIFTNNLFSMFQKFSVVIIFQHSHFLNGYPIRFDKYFAL